MLCSNALPPCAEPIAPLPVALYVHLPWCLKKCPYCDFNSHAVRAGLILPEAAYLDALCADLDAAAPALCGRRIESIFLGGGTPSLFSASGIDRFLTYCQQHLSLAADCEISLEANPGAADEARFAGYAAAGVNRLSLGVQSFSDAALHALGRIHNGYAADHALAAALRHFPRVNIDLMYGLPGQTPEAAAADATRAAASGAGHVSAYHLSIEPNTAFHAQPPVLPDEDTVVQMQEAVHAALLAAGLQHYEISAYARPGNACRHNLNYWQFGDYLGIGAGAHGKLSLADGIWRETRARHPEDYINETRRLSSRLRIAASDLPLEFMMNALRLIAGAPRAYFTQRTGLPLSVLAAPLAQAQELGLLAPDPDYFRASAQGQRFLNRLLLLFVPEHSGETSKGNTAGEIQGSERGGAAILPP